MEEFLLPASSSSVLKRAASWVLKMVRSCPIFAVGGSVFLSSTLYQYWFELIVRRKGWHDNGKIHHGAIIRNSCSTVSVGSNRLGPGKVGESMPWNLTRKTSRYQMDGRRFFGVLNTVKTLLLERCWSNFIEELVHLFLSLLLLLLLELQQQKSPHLQD